MSQDQVNPRRDDDEIDEGAPPPTGDTSSAQQAAEDVDDLLDEIDGVLEEDAEEFVKGYVQKGGQ